MSFCKAAQETDAAHDYRNGVCILCGAVSSARGGFVHARDQLGGRRVSKIDPKRCLALVRAWASDGDMHTMIVLDDVHEVCDLAERGLATIEALNEVITNGRWSGGRDFSGEWCIAREVYEMAQDALDATATIGHMKNDRGEPSDV